MFIGFLAYTNDAIITPQRDADISRLDDTVLDALDIDKNDGSLISAAGARAQPAAVLPGAAG